MPDRLELSIIVRPVETGRREEFNALLSLANTGSDPISLNLAPLSSPSLALEIIDGRGDHVPLPPPPVPGGQSPAAELAPGRSHTVQFEGFLPQWVPGGLYRARLRYIYRPAAPSAHEWTGEAASDWAEFRVLGEA